MNDAREETMNREFSYPIVREIRRETGPARMSGGRIPLPMPVAAPTLGDAEKSVADPPSPEKAGQREGAVARAR